VGKVGLSTASDILLWEFAREGGFTILTKDEDFNFLSMLRGPPPKVIWLRTGNSSVDQIEALLRENVSSILDFIQSEIRVLELYS
jgi:predicted nuclease of predicted toxin-antitoxin system